MVQSDGVCGLYRGLGVSLLGSIPSVGIYFFLYEVLCMFVCDVACSANLTRHRMTHLGGSVKFNSTTLFTLFRQELGILGLLLPCRFTPFSSSIVCNCGRMFPREYLER